jgi:hypothetical protein
LEPVDTDRVRDDLARLGGDDTSAPDVPPAVTARVVTALRNAGRRGRAARFAAVAGVLAAVVGVGLGTAMLLQPGSAPPPTDKREPWPAHAATIPLSPSDIVGLLSQPPQLGALTDPQRLSSCLAGLGYPGSTTVLGATQVDINGTPAVLLVLPGDPPETLSALAVRNNCSAIDTGLIADTHITRPPGAPAG